MFIAKSVLEGNSLRQDAEKRIGKTEEHCYANPDQEGGIDEAGQQEHEFLELRDQLRLARGRFQKLASHDADTDTGANCTKPNDDTDTECSEALNLGGKLFHFS